MNQLAFKLPEQAEPTQYLSASRFGYFSILHSPTGLVKKQNSYPLSKLAWVIDHVDPNRDCWISQAEFIRPNRRVVNLSRIGLCFVDLDTYHTDLSWMKPDGLCFALLDFCQSEGIPTPSVVIYSGRGLQIKWIFDNTIPRQALPRWNACQREFVSRLSRFGADPSAKDASRVLRLVNTVNTKSGEVCRVLHANGQLYGFDELAEAILPAGRDELKEKREKIRVVTGGKTGNLKALHGNRLAWDRLEDLRKLVLMRGGVSEGERMIHLHWQLNFLLLSGATSAKQMFYEARALARELDPYWSYQQGELSTLYQKAKEFNAGKRVEFNGRMYPALYTPKNNTLINLFQITNDESQHLRTIIPEGERLERQRKRNKANEEKRRRAAGATSRDEYEAKACKLREQVKALKLEGMKGKDIALSLGITAARVSQILKN